MAGRARGYIYTRMEIEEPGAAYKHELELNELRKYAHEAGLEVLDEYADENYGPENIRSWYDFLWMKNAIISHKRQIDCVITSDLGCLGRNFQEIMETLEEFQRRNVKVICFNDYIDSMENPDYLLIATLAAADRIFQKDLELKREELAWDEETAPYGIRMVQKNLVIEPDSQQLVRQVFEDYLECGNINLVYRNFQEKIKKDYKNTWELTVYGKKLIEGLLNDSVYWQKHGALIPMELAQAVYKKRIREISLWKQKHNRDRKLPMVISEKQLYYKELQKFREEHSGQDFLLGEDLADKHLIIYRNAWIDVKAYIDFTSHLSKMLLVVIRYNQRVLEPVEVQYDPCIGNIYITEKQFNSVWKDLKWSVQFGIERGKLRMGKFEPENPEGIVVLHRLCEERLTAHLTDDKVAYERRRQTPTYIRDARKRQSKLDNPQNYFYYSKEGGLVHDKTCGWLKQIPSEDFEASSQFPAGRKCCPECARVMFLRYACRPVTKKIPICEQLLRRYQLNTQELGRLVLECGLRFEAIDMNSMKVIGKEDSWIIKEDTQYHTLELWHNNYIRLSETERYITDGFHNQGIYGATMKELLNCIVNYTWDKHLEGEEQKRLRNQKPVTTYQFSLMPDEAVSILGSRKKKMMEIPMRNSGWKKGRRG